MKNNNNILPEILFLFVFVSLLVLIHVIYKKYCKVEEKAENMLITCETCNGKGETSQSIADLICAGRSYMFIDSHKKQCLECKKGHSVCNDAKKMLESIKEETEQKETRVLLYSCPDCFGKCKK